LEHLNQKDLISLFKNIKKHCSNKANLIFSICTKDDFHGNINLHQTVKNKNWWIDFFFKNGFVEDKQLYKYFNNFYVRSNINNAPDSFVIILKKRKTKTSCIKLTLFDKAIDYLYNKGFLNTAFKTTNMWWKEENFNYFELIFISLFGYKIFKSFKKKINLILL